MYLAAREAGHWLLREEAAQMRPHLGLYASALEGRSNTIAHFRQCWPWTRTCTLH